MSVWRQSEDWVGSQIDDSWVMLNFTDGEYVSFNETAAEVWHAIEKEAQSEEQIVDVLIERFDIDRERCATSVRTLLKDLLAKNLVTCDE